MQKLSNFTRCHLSMGIILFRARESCSECLPTSSTVCPHFSDSFSVLGSTLKPLKHLAVTFVKSEVKDRVSFFWVYNTPSLPSTRCWLGCLFPMCILTSLSEISRHGCMGSHLILYSFFLIHMSVFVPLPGCFYCHD